MMLCLRKKFLFASLVVSTMVFLGLTMAATAWAAPPYNILDNPAGGQCFEIGVWDNGTKTCTLTGDVLVNGVNAISVAGDGITVDGAGHSVTRVPSADFLTAVAVTGLNNVTIRNLEIDGFDQGIVVSGGSGNQVQSNTVNNTVYGIYLAGTGSVIGNTLTTGSAGITLFATDAVVVANNTLTGMTFRALDLNAATNSIISSNNTHDNSGDGIYLEPGSDSNVISGNTSNSSWAGMRTVDADNNTIINNTFTANNIGMFLSDSDGNTVKGNRIESSTNYGARVDGINPSNNTFIGNAIEGSGAGGIWVRNALNTSFIGNSVYNNTSAGVEFDTVSTGVIRGNTISNPGTYGVMLGTSTNVSVYNNNFIGNNVSFGGGAGSGNQLHDVTYGGNYWSDYDAPDEGCTNTTPFDKYCDTEHSAGSLTDTQPWVFQDAWSRYEWTWYDNLNGDNWALMAAPSGAPDHAWFQFSVAGGMQSLPTLDGYSMGEVPQGRAITPQFSLMDGPVSAAVVNGVKPIVSQRTLWPKGGNSLEEVPGTEANRLSDTFYWTWYDQLSPGMQNWIIVTNPNPFPVDYTITLGGVDRTPVSHTIAAGERGTPQLPGFRGGPLVVKATISGSADPANIMASQRVLSDGGAAFNEVPGMPGPEVSSQYIWTWYDEQSQASQDWVLVANPNLPGGADIYFRIDVAGGCGDPAPPDSACYYGGPVAPSQTSVHEFPGVRNGPVTVTGYTDLSYTTPTNIVASQRAIWGPSFEEVPGYAVDRLAHDYDWSWYDQKNAGVTDWVMVANPTADTVTAIVSFTDRDTGAPVNATYDIAPGGRWTPTFPGNIGGPVHVTAYKTGQLGNFRNVMVSQRVIWKGYFNEVLGTAVN